MGLTGGLTFVDTNVLVYAEDGREAARRDAAVQVLGDLWASGLGVISTQVLQEFYNVATRKLRMPPGAARRIVAEYAEWPMGRRGRAALRRDDPAQRGPPGRTRGRRPGDPGPVRSA